MPLAQLAGWVSDPLALELILFVSSSTIQVFRRLPVSRVTQQILRRDPDERPTLAEIKHHQFFAGVYVQFPSSRGPVYLRFSQRVEECGRTAL